MASQPSVYGRSIACINDADALFSAVTGVDLVIQDAIHRLTNDSVLGPGGDGWGYDVRRLVGMRASELNAMQAFLVEVLQRDDRIHTVDVTLTAIGNESTADVRIEISATTSAGPFSFVKSVSELTAGDIEAQGQG